MLSFDSPQELRWAACTSSRVVTTGSRGRTPAPACVTPSGTGSTRGITAESAAWTWSASRPNRSTTGSRASSTARCPTSGPRAGSATLTAATSQSSYQRTSTAGSGQPTRSRWGQPMGDSSTTGHTLAGNELIIQSKIFHFDIFQNL